MKLITCPTCNGKGKVNPMSAGLAYKIIGERIQKKREKMGLSQEDLAAKVGLLRTSITNTEAGRQKIPLEGLYRIAEALEMEVKDLIP